MPYVPVAALSHFYPRPPRGGRRGILVNQYVAVRFLSTPSARRATACADQRHQCQHRISIHALREEGDDQVPMRGHRVQISIHALREEGDVTGNGEEGELTIFLSTPSARRATTQIWLQRSCRTNFYPRPPRGGRRLCIRKTRTR